MTYRINRTIRDADFERHNTKEQKYLDDLESRGLLLEIDNICVDAEQLVLRTFQCNTGYCVKCTGSNSTREYKGSCCTDLMVDLTSGEKGKLRELASLARKKGRLQAGDPIAKIVTQVLEDRFTELNDDHEEQLRHRKNGSCIMSWMDSQGQLRCSTNTLVDRLGLKLTDYKPDPCYLFPLHYAEIGRDRMIVTVLSEETQWWIEQDKCVGRLRCLRTPEPGSPPTYQFLRGELEYMLGKAFYAELDRQARGLLDRFHAGEFDTRFTPAPERR
jgi:hypothetical protein